MFLQATAPCLVLGKHWSYIFFDVKSGHLCEKVNKEEIKMWWNFRVIFWQPASQNVFISHSIGTLVYQYSPIGCSMYLLYLTCLTVQKEILELDWLLWMIWLMIPVEVWLFCFVVYILHILAMISSRNVLKAACVKSPKGAKHFVTQFGIHSLLMVS